MNVFINLRNKFKFNLVCDAWWDFALGSIQNLKVILNKNFFTLIFWGRGSTLKELNALETLVKVKTRIWTFPTSKSLKIILSGFPINAEPLNTLVPIFCTFVIFFRWASLANSKCRFYYSVRVPGLRILSPSSSYSVNASD